ncbi:MAG: Gfo/Idh/MocA family oxidoreductase [Patescibacteria group bacterium]
MSRLKIAVLGASGIGKFYVREFLHAGAEVVAILGSSKETAEKTVAKLSSEYIFSPKAYFDLDMLIQNESLDAVSVCTPPEFHYPQVKRCLEAGLHVLCEKPFILDSECDNSQKTTELVKLAEKKKLVLGVNMQWPSVLKYFKPFVDLSNVQDFFMFMQPSVKGKEMLIEQLSHMNSVLIRLIPNGKAEKIEFSTQAPEAEEIDVHFGYFNKNSKSKVHYKFKHKADRPRDIRFSINGIEFKRHVGEDYKQKFITDKNEIDIEDPFKISIGMFIGAIEGKGSPLISGEEIIENIALQDRIIAEYTKRTIMPIRLTL